MIATTNRLLVQGRGGELLLVDISGDKPRIISRAHVGNDDGREAELFTFPAIVGTRLFARGERELVCIELGS
jgi:hypothetical protein